VPYLDDLVSIIRVHVLAIHSAVEHLEIPPVCVERPQLPLLPPLGQVVPTDPVEEQHHLPLAAILLENSGTPIP
jgi:hypothetical protein